MEYMPYFRGTLKDQSEIAEYNKAIKRGYVEFIHSDDKEYATSIFMNTFTKDGKQTQIETIDVTRMYFTLVLHGAIEPNRDVLEKGKEMIRHLYEEQTAEYGEPMYAVNPKMKKFVDQADNAYNMSDKMPLTVDRAYIALFCLSRKGDIYANAVGDILAAHLNTKAFLLDPTTLQTITMCCSGRKDMVEKIFNHTMLIAQRMSMAAIPIEEVIPVVMNFAIVYETMGKTDEEITELIKKNILISSTLEEVQVFFNQQLGGCM